MLHIFLKRISVPPIVILLSACNPGYIQPTSGPIATIILSNFTDKSMLVTNYDDEKICTNPQGIGTVNPGTEITLAFQAEEPTTLSIQYLGIRATMIESCIFMPTFTPRTGELYNIQLFNEQKHCSFFLYRILGPSKLELVAPVTMRK